MMRGSSGMSVSKAAKFLASKGMYYYSLRFAYKWNTGYNIFHWGF